LNTIFTESGFFVNLFDAIPSPLFVVDEDVRILHMNRAAKALPGISNASAFMTRSGDALHCIRAEETPAGCGHSPSCRDCVIRTSVAESFGGNRVYRQKTQMSLVTERGIRSKHVLVTTSPFAFDNRNFSLLILEDISELLQLRSLLPICAWCKKIRNDDDYWQELEKYFGEQLDLGFTHGICEDCMRKYDLDPDD
jgi:PAS domain-containing protein